MDISEYEYLWEDENYVLVKSILGYSIINSVTKGFMLLDDERLEKKIISKMLQKGVPIYQSYTDLLNKCAPINIVGKPIGFDDFPVKKYKIYIEWLSNIPLAVQVKEFKKIFLKGNYQSNQELIQIAKNAVRWQFDTLYLDEDQKAQIVKLAEEHGLKVFFELESLLPSNGSHDNI